METQIGVSRTSSLLVIIISQENTDHASQPNQHLVALIRVQKNQEKYILKIKFMLLIFIQLVERKAL